MPEEEPLPGAYDCYVAGKSAEEILAQGQTAHSTFASYLQVAAQVRSNQELIAALGRASDDSAKTATRIVWLTGALVLVGIIQACATALPYLFR